MKRRMKKPIIAAIRYAPKKRLEICIVYHFAIEKEFYAYTHLVTRFPYNELKFIGEMSARALRFEFSDDGCSGEVIALTFDDEEA